MSVIKNEFPILEFDSDQEAMIMPDHENLEMVLPKKAVFAFLGEAIDEYAKNHNAKIVGIFESMTKKISRLYY